MTGIIDWYRQRLAEDRSIVEEIPFSQLESWHFDDAGNIRHASGKFFSVLGIRTTVENAEMFQEQEQPIVSQPEHGILGILTKNTREGRMYLLQAKMEPGNINKLQLSPTVQVTHSNFTRVHNGASPRYLDYFLESCNDSVLLDSLQAEQGSRFLNKQNRNVVVETPNDVNVYENYTWVHERDIGGLLKARCLVNMSCRSVLSCFLSTTVLPERGSLNSMAGVTKWMEELRDRTAMAATLAPLNSLRDLVKNEHELFCSTRADFSVVAVRVRSDSREVSRWTQPVLKQKSSSIAAFIIKKFNGMDHFLVQGKFEPGHLGKLYLAPTIHLARCQAHSSVPYMDAVLNRKNAITRYECTLSEEGGRLLNHQNEYLAIEVEEDLEVTPVHIWISYPQMLSFIRRSLVNVEARSIMAAIGFSDYR